LALGVTEGELLSLLLLESRGVGVALLLMLVSSSSASWTVVSW
jgi:hypothetical protein